MTASALPLPAAASRATASLQFGNRMAACQALVIDANPASRTALTAMFRDFGVGAVVPSSRAQDARRMLEHRRFDIVVCEYHFANQAMTGQDLLDDLRLANLLPLATVVVMISSEAAYLNVAEAAEAALDAYLIKPHTEQALRERVMQAFERKDALRPIIDHVERGAFEEAAELCQQHCDRRDRHWLNAARIGADLWLRLGRPQAAQALFETILATRALPWARLGVARSEYHAGGVMHARRTLESLLNEHSGYADAYDVMARVLLDQGEPEQALDALRRGCAITPGCVSRLLKLGLVAFYHGERKEAVEALQRASALGLNSKVFDRSTCRARSCLAPCSLTAVTTAGWHSLCTRCRRHARRNPRAPGCDASRPCSARSRCCSSGGFPRLSCRQSRPCGNCGNPTMTSRQRATCWVCCRALSRER